MFKPLILVKKWMGIVQLDFQVLFQVHVCLSDASERRNFCVKQQRWLSQGGRKEGSCVKNRTNAASR
jgi:hypothetical protein